MKGLHPLGCKLGIRRRGVGRWETGPCLLCCLRLALTGPAMVLPLLLTPETRWPHCRWLLLFPCSSLPQGLCSTASLFLDSLPFSNAALCIPPYSDFNREDFYSACRSRLNCSSYMEALTNFQLPPPPGLHPSGLCIYAGIYLFSRSVMSDSLRPQGLGTSGFPVLHHLLEFAQKHVHWVGDAIQPSHPLPSPSPPALTLSQHQGLFQWVRWP